MKGFNRTDRTILIALSLGIWFLGISLWIQPAPLNAHDGMSADEIDDFNSAARRAIDGNCYADVSTVPDSAYIYC